MKRNFHLLSQAPPPFGHPDSINVTTFAFEAGKLKAIYMVRNPHKLEGVRW